MIYLNKIDLLDIISHTLQLKTVPGVVREFGSTSVFRHMEVIELNKIISPEKETDDFLMETAKFLKIPIVSEDKKILMQAKKSDLWYFNTLMIMNFLIYKQKIDENRYEAALDILQTDAYYDAFIFEYGKMVYDKIIGNRV